MPKNEFDPEDPFELVGVEVPTEAEEVLENIVQEYLFMGWKPDLIFFLFRSPYYGATHQIYQQLGHERVKERVHQLAAQWQRGWLAGSPSTPSAGGEQHA